MSRGTIARATLVGRLGNPPEVKTIKGNTRVANLSVAVSSGYGDNVTTSWFNVQVFGDKRIDALVSYAGKGSKVFIEGELRIRQYEKDGGKRYATEIIVGFDGVVEIVSSKEEDSRNGGGSGSSQPRPKPQPQPAFDSELDDDVPF